MGRGPRRDPSRHPPGGTVILADTSAWIEFLRGTGSSVDRCFDALIAGDELATTDVVVLELLAGSHPDRVRDEHRLLQSVEFLPQHPLDDVTHAADLYRFCRSRGVTIRSVNDCLIAAVAIRTNVPVLHADADLLCLSDLTRLEVVQP